jgi:L-lactate dehydrogenase complex protein LldG
MSSRDAILGRIRNALGNEPALDRPPVPKVWPRQDPGIEDMVRRFTDELQAVSGEVHRCASTDEAGKHLADLAHEGGWTKIAGVDRPMCRDVTSELPEDRLTWVGSEATAKDLAELDAGLIEADTLLADTGTCMIANATPQQRIVCYLPPVCIVVARTDQLVEHMPAAWEKIAPRVAAPELRGEFVFITGPSRTADIEKILILGVHGPKRLIVLLVG